MGPIAGTRNVARTAWCGSPPVVRQRAAAGEVFCLGSELRSHLRRAERQRDGAPAATHKARGAFDLPADHDQPRRCPAAVELAIRSALTTMHFHLPRPLRGWRAFI